MYRSVYTDSHVMLTPHIHPHIALITPYNYTYTMPPRVYNKDPAWDTVVLTHRLHNNPDTECIYCGYTQTTNSPSRIIIHLKKCPHLPATLYGKYHPRKLRSVATSEGEALLSEASSGTSTSRKRGYIASYFDVITEEHK